MQLGALEGDVDTGDPPPPFDLAAGGGKGHLPALSTHAVLIDSAAASDLKWLSFNCSKTLKTDPAWVLSCLGCESRVTPLGLLGTPFLQELSWAC